MLRYDSEAFLYLDRGALSKFYAELDEKLDLHLTTLCLRLLPPLSFHLLLLRFIHLYLLSSFSSPLHPRTFCSGGRRLRRPT